MEAVDHYGQPPRRRQSSRDFQRSAVYAWEDKAACRADRHPCFERLEDCQEWLDPIWRAERGRYGRARVPTPLIERPSWGQRSAIAHYDHRITLPRWARSRWVILHEAAHRLVTPGADDPGHGRRFVGCLIGLVCRHLDYEASELMQQADEMGVLYDVRSIGSVPVHGPVWHVTRAVCEYGPMTAMEIACHLDVLHGQHLALPQIYGAAVSMIRAGQARWLRGKLHLLAESPQGDAREQRWAA